MVLILNYLVSTLDNYNVAGSYIVSANLVAAVNIN